MEIDKIIVRNFRLLKELSIDLENALSLIIGKNNVGKTSLLLILDQFLGVKVQVCSRSKKGRRERGDGYLFHE